MKFTPAPHYKSYDNFDDSSEKWQRGARQTRSGVVQRLARKYWIAVAFGISVPAITTFASVLPMGLSGSAIAGSFVGMAVFYILVVATEMLETLRKVEDQWAEREEQIEKQNDYVLTLHESVEYYRSRASNARGGLTVAGANNNPEKTASVTVIRGKRNGAAR